MMERMDTATSLIQEPAISPEPLFEHIDHGVQSFARIAALIAASRYLFFDHLATPRTPEELARLTKGRAEIICHVLPVLEEMGLVTSSEGKFSSTPLSRVFLATSSPYRQGAYLDKTWRHINDLWLHLPGIMEKGPVSYSQDLFFRELSLPAMAENALSGRLQRIVREIASLPQFHSFRKMVDLGGGHGLYAIALAAMHPLLHAWVFDMPHVIPLANRYIQQYHVSRVHTLEGNFFVDDFGKEYDLVFSSSNPSGKQVGMVRRIADSLNPGGVFVNVQSMGKQSLDIYQSLEMQLWEIEGEKKDKGSYTKEQPFLTDEYRGALSDAGFSIQMEKDIRDDYHKGAFVRMIVAEKKS